MRYKTLLKGRWKWLLVPVALIVAAGALGKMLNASPPTNSAQSAPDAAPELRTRVYARTPDEVRRVARQVAGEQKTWFRSWRVGPTDDDSALRVAVPVLMFTDDLTIRMDESDGQTRVNVESRSRVGQGDFGENRRHVVQFLRALDEQLNSP